jgi:dimethylargininase
MIRFQHAILRRPGPNLGAGLTNAEIGVPDHRRALGQHTRYIEALERAAVHVTVLDALPDFPDAYFVEDVAIVTPEVTVLARPGAAERRGEEACMEPVLARIRPIERIREPGCLDGGDVLIVGRRVLVGLSSRTNEHGARQLLDILARHSYRGETIQVGGGLHLKSSVNLVAEDTVIVTRQLAQHSALGGMGCILTPDGEEYCANALRVNDCLLVPSGFPGTRARLETLDVTIVELDVSEMRKMDGGLTCLSLRF